MDQGSGGAMKMSEPRKGMRVALTPEIFARHQDSLIVRRFGTLTSGRILPSRGRFVEGLCVRVKWDGLTTPEKWDLCDLVPAKEMP